MDDSAPQAAEILVVGAGIAARRFVARMLEDPDRAVRITVFGDEARLPYDRSGLARVVSGAPASAIELDRGPFRDDRVRLIDDDRVLRIDRARCRVRTRSQRWYDYDTLVLATGTHARPLDVPGIHARGAFVVRTLEDAQTLRAFLAVRSAELPRPLRAVVVGGGADGVDVAFTLQDAGVRTTLVDSADRLFAAQLSWHAAASLRRIVESRGITVRTRTRLTRVDPDETGAVTAVEFQDGSFARADLVVTVRARARDELARNAGLPVHPDGGIVVDAAGVTDDPQILAIGDAAVAADDRGRGVEAAELSAVRAADALCGARQHPGPRGWRGAPGGVDIATVRVGGEEDGAIAIPLRTHDRRAFGEVVISADASRVHGATVIGERTPTWLTRLSHDDVGSHAVVRALLAEEEAEDHEEQCGHAIRHLDADGLRVHMGRHGVRTFPEAVAAAPESRDCGPCLRHLAVALLDTAEAAAEPAPPRSRRHPADVRLRGTASAPVVEVRVGAVVDASLLLVIARLAARHDAAVRIGAGTIDVEGIGDDDLSRALADLRAAAAPLVDDEAGQPVTAMAGRPTAAARHPRETRGRVVRSAAGARSVEGSA
ncbi:MULTISPECIES: FAD-dependent oxidoreductase [Microbacterium]|uniref:FAD-dependent oxidoreductase n=1 Tax=Microbacterium TaxID=33882 RepID=UPI0013571BED|nr:MULTISPECIES: FAD-dependent oxidoreductase [Microbacterium]